MDTNTIALMIIALSNMITAALVYLNHRLQLKTGAQIDILERNTNSIKDALVASTAKASHAEGVLVGRQLENSEQQHPDQDRVVKKETIIERVVEKQEDK